MTEVVFSSSEVVSRSKHQASLDPSSAMSAARPAASWARMGAVLFRQVGDGLQLGDFCSALALAGGVPAAGLEISPKSRLPRALNSNSTKRDFSASSWRGLMRIWSKVVVTGRRSGW